MITVEEIIERIEQKEAEDKIAAEKHSQKNALKSGKKWKPDTIDEYIVPEFNLSDSEATAAGQKKYGTLSKILTFVDLARWSRIGESCTIMPISVTSARNLAIFGSEMNVSRAVDKMIEIGILEAYDEKYRFNAPFPFEDENKSKRYKYFYDNEQKFIEYCKKHNIEKYVPAYKHEFSAEELEIIEKVKSEHREFKIEDVRFSSDLNLIMPLGLKKSEFKLFLEWCLYRNYPMFAFYKMKIQEINERYYKDYPQFELSFEPKIILKKGKNFTRAVKISIRATNSYDNISKKEREEKILAQYGMRLLSDIKSSVPRLTKSLNEGEWFSKSDMYELINKVFDPGFVPESKEAKDKRREAIKKLHMFAYFETHSDKNMGKNVWRRMARKGAKRDEVYEVMRRLKEAIIKVEGKLYKSEIFYVESCVYAMTVYDLLSAGHNVWLVYDAFYSKGGTYAVCPEGKTYTNCGKNERDVFCCESETQEVCPDELIAHSIRENFRDFYNMDFCHWGDVKEYEDKEQPKKFVF